MLTINIIYLTPTAVVQVYEADGIPMCHPASLAHYSNQLLVYKKPTFINILLNFNNLKFYFNNLENFVWLGKQEIVLAL